MATKRFPIHYSMWSIWLRAVLECMCVQKRNYIGWNANRMRVRVGLLWLISIGIVFEQRQSTIGKCKRKNFKSQVLMCHTQIEIRFHFRIYELRDSFSQRGTNRMMSWARKYQCHLMDIDISSKIIAPENRNREFVRRSNHCLIDGSIQKRKTRLSNLSHRTSSEHAAATVLDVNVINLTNLENRACMDIHMCVCRKLRIASHLFYVSSWCIGVARRNY